MKHLIFAACSFLSFTAIYAQSAPVKPCTANPLYRQFDFWIGQWDVYATNGNKAGESEIEIMLDSCIIFENWTSSQGNYTGKSFNTYNSQLNQWQQTWVDDKGGLTEYFGQYADNKMMLTTKPFPFSKDTIATRKMTFHNLSPDKVRQHGEITKDSTKSWSTEFDLEYRRRK